MISPRFFWHLVLVADPELRSGGFTPSLSENLARSADWWAGAAGYISGGGLGGGAEVPPRK